MVVNIRCLAYETHSNTWPNTSCFSQTKKSSPRDEKSFLIPTKAESMHICHRLSWFWCLSTVISERFLGCGDSSTINFRWSLSEHADSLPCEPRGAADGHFYSIWWTCVLAKTNEGAGEKHARRCLALMLMDVILGKSSDTSCTKFPIQAFEYRRLFPNHLEMTNSTWGCLASSTKLDESAAKSISARSEAIINRCDDLIHCTDVLNTSRVHTLRSVMCTPVF